MFGAGRKRALPDVLDRLGSQPRKANAGRHFSTLRPLGSTRRYGPAQM
jgi:hypothetical protein